MELDGAGAQEYCLADLGIGPPLRHQQGDLQFLGRQLLTAVSRVCQCLAGGAKLSPGPLGPWACVKPVEDLQSGTELDARVPAAPRPPQPFPVAQVRAGMLKRD